MLRGDEIHFVEDVENLSTADVDKHPIQSRMWRMWKTYPHSLWISGE
jgi:hypothetical protein